MTMAGSMVMVRIRAMAMPRPAITPSSDTPT